MLFVNKNIWIFSIVESKNLHQLLLAQQLMSKFIIQKILSNIFCQVLKKDCHKIQNNLDFFEWNIIFLIN